MTSELDAYRSVFYELTKCLDHVADAEHFASNDRGDYLLPRELIDKIQFARIDIEKLREEIHAAAIERTGSEL